MKLEALPNNAEHIPVSVPIATAHRDWGVGNIVLIVIILVGGWMRFSHLGDQSQGFFADEALYAYDGLSIARIGTDHRQTGHPPLYLKGYSAAFDNRTSILYPYILAGFFSVLTPTTWLVRLPAALAGTLIIFMTYLVSREFFPKRREIGLIAAGFAALSPETIWWSRHGHDPIFVPFFLLCIIWAQWRARRHPWLWILAGAALAIGLYGYQPFKLVGPFVFLLGLWSQRDYLLTAKKWLLVGLGLAGLIAAPLVFTQLKHWTEVQGDFMVINIWRYANPWSVLVTNVHRIFGLSYFLSNTQVFIFLLPLFMIGAWRSGDDQPRLRIFLWLLALVAIVPALITVLGGSDEVVTRTMGLVGFLEIGAAAGLVWLADRFVHGRASGASITMAAGLLLPLVFQAWIQYSSLNIHGPLFFPGYDRAITILQAPPWEKRQVVFDLLNPVQPMMTLWLLRYPPIDFQHESHDWQQDPDFRGPLDFPTRFGRYRFCQVEQCYRPHDRALYVVMANQYNNLPTIATLSIDNADWKIVDNN